MAEAFPRACAHLDRAALNKDARWAVNYVERDLAYRDPEETRMGYVWAKNMDVLRRKMPVQEFAPFFEALGIRTGVVRGGAGSAGE